MTSQLQLNHMIRELNVYRRAFITLHGWKLIVEFSAKDGLLIRTPVYQGDGYVPPGVREALYTNPLEGDSSLHTYVKLDADTYTISLYHSGSTQDLSSGFAELLEEFTWIAERWWHYLDERDRRDLVYLYIK